MHHKINVNKFVCSDQTVQIVRRIIHHESVHVERGKQRQIFQMNWFYLWFTSMRSREDSVIYEMNHIQNENYVLSRWARIQQCEIVAILENSPQKNMSHLI